MGQKRARKTSVKKGPRKEPGKGRKRQKTTHKEIPLNISEAHNQMKRGILERIADVPVDILCEILLHLSPKDLLSLTKASRDLKALLMDDTYIFIWRHARTVHEPELPPLPRGFTEYEYANLVFDTHCHECEKPLSKNVLWAAKVRLCGSCFEDKTITSFATPPRWLDPILMDISCHVNPKYRRNARASIWGDDSSSISADTPHVWYLNGADELMAQLEELKLTGDDAKIQEWLREKKSEAEDGIELCKALNTFTISMQNRRYDELQSLRQERQRSVFERLNAAGWGEELAHGSTIREIQFNELVDQPKVLTDKAWKDIEPRLTSHLKKIRAQIKMKSDGDVLDARLALFSERYDRLVGPLPFLPPFPPRNDVLRYAPFKSTIFETPLNQGTLKDRLELDFQLHWDSICAKWRRIHEGTLKSMLVESGQSDDLNLAMNAFECDDCSALVNYPVVLVHHCYRSHIEACNAADFGRSSSLKLFYNVPNYWTRWHLERIIIACGLDPTSATTREMDKLDVFLYCVPCSKVDRYHDPHALVPRRPNQLIVAMRWNDAAAIPHPAHDQSSSPSWEILSDRDLLRAVRAEDLRHRFGGLEGCEDQNIMCLHCDDEQRYVEDEMKEHLLTVHDITISLDQAVTSHYRPHVASKRYRQPTCYIVQSCDKGGFEVTLSHRS